MPGPVSDFDLRALVNVLQEGRRDEPTDGLPWASLHELFKLVRCDSVSFPEVDLVHGRGLFHQWLDGDGRGQEIDDRDNPCPDEEGYGNTAIAQTLFISTATVRKHLEHVYDRTGTRDRHAAAALMVPHHDADRAPTTRQPRTSLGC